MHGRVPRESCTDDKIAPAKHVQLYLYCTRKCSTGQRERLVSRLEGMQAQGSLNCTGKF